MKLVLDANVLVAAVRTPETDHLPSLHLLQQAERRAVGFFCPVLVLAECAAAIVRQTDRPVLAERAITLIDSLSNLRLVVVDDLIARRAMRIAIAQRLRGADAVYVAVAEACGATLVSWDAEMLQRGAAVVTTMTPADWLQTHS